MKILVIADSHISPACPNVKDWENLGHYVVKNKPDCIVHLGDVADLSSLAWMKAARGNFTTEEEMSVVSEHLEAFEDVLSADRRRSRKNKKAIYKPVKVLCLGNHDVRNGFTGVQELFEEFDWNVYDYLTPVTIDGVTFCHCMMKGTSDTPCTTAEELLENWHGNLVVGHGHTQDYSESYSTAINERIRALRSPMFNAGDTGWAKQTRHKWARGFTEIETKPFQFMWKDLSWLSVIS